MSFSLQNITMTGGMSYTVPQLTGSILFNGSTQYLGTALTTNGDLGTGDFTVEFWMKASAGGTYVAVVGTQSIAGATTSGMWRVSNRLNSANGMYFNYTTGSAFVDLTFSTTNYNDGNWHHVAACRASGTLKMYVDGVSVGTPTAVSQSLSSGQKIYVAYQPQDNQYYTGYVTNVRIVKGVAVYTANFTPSTTPLTSTQSANINGNPSAEITGTSTSLLLNTINNVNFLIDSSSYNNTITNFGTSTAQALNPFNLGNPGSILFNGTTQYLSSVGTTSGPLDLATGAGNWTVECWFYLNSVTGQQSIFWKGGTTGSVNPSYCLFINGTSSQWIVGDGGGGGIVQNMTTVFAIGSWYHFALVRNGSTVTAYVNGVSQTPLTITSMGNTSNNNLSIGSSVADGSTRYLNGYVSNLRIVKGAAVYTSNFVLPAGPLTSIQYTNQNGNPVAAITGTQTSLLLNTPNGAGYITDTSTNALTVTNNGTATSQALSPFSF